MKDIEKLQTLYEVGVGGAPQIKHLDLNGDTIVETGEYMLQHKRSKFYYGGGNIHAPQQAEDPNEAIVLPGDYLKYMAYDWSLDWDAILALD